MVEPDGKYWLIEITARGGGCGISSEITPWVTSIDQIEYHYRNLKGENLPPLPEPRLLRPAILKFHEFEEGESDPAQMKRAEERIKRDPNVHLFLFNFKENAYLKQPTCDQDRHSITIIRTETNQDLEESLRRVETILSEENLLKRD